MIRADAHQPWPQKAIASVTARIFLGVPTRTRVGSSPSAPLISVGDIRDGRVHAPPQAQHARFGDEAVRYQVHADDILVTCRGTQLKVALVDPASDGALISANLLAIRTSEELLAPLLLAYLTSAEGQSAVLSRARSSTMGLSLTPGALGSIPVPVPPLIVQRELAELIRASEENFLAATRAAAQRRAIARAATMDLLTGRRSRAQDDRA